MLYIPGIEVEYDDHKSAANEEKHGVDFETAKALWDDPNLLVIPARTEDEPRSLVIGFMDGKHWSAVITPRGERIRIISVRRARHKEVMLYEGV